MHRAPRRRVRRRQRLRFATGLALAFAFSFLAGLTDAVGFLLAGAFVSFMSGNTTQLAIAAAGGDGSTAARLAALLAFFVAGNVFGVLLMYAARSSHLALLLFIALLAAVPLVPGLLFTAPFALAFAMGCLNVGLEEVGGHTVGITYVTGALSRLGRGIGRFLIGRGSHATWIQFVPWLGMAAGAVLGGWLQGRFGARAVGAVAICAATLAIVVAPLPRAWRLRYLAKPERSRRAAAPRPAG